MLSETQNWTDDEIKRATRLLRKIRDYPALWVTKFERQFINAKLRFFLSLLFTLGKCYLLASACWEMTPDTRDGTGQQI